jgi:hypothetical protein
MVVMVAKCECASCHRTMYLKLVKMENTYFYVTKLKTLKQKSNGRSSCFKKSILRLKVWLKW